MRRVAAVALATLVVCSMQRTRRTRATRRLIPDASRCRSVRCGSATRCSGPRTRTRRRRPAASSRSSRPPASSRPCSASKCAPRFVCCRRSKWKSKDRYGHPELRVAISGDSEGAAAVTAVDTVQQFTIGGGAVWYLPRIDATPGAVRHRRHRPAAADAPGSDLARDRPLLSGRRRGEVLPVLAAERVLQRVRAYVRTFARSCGQREWRSMTADTPRRRRACPRSCASDR